MTDRDIIEVSEQQGVNRRLSEVEVFLGRAKLNSMPRNLGIVIGNGCNIDCPHCYQLKNGDSLFRDDEIGSLLRREISSFYPYLSTLRLQGGEVFALKGFKEFVADIASQTDRPLISISTNATMINEEWAKTIVEMPFQHITVSLDAAYEETYEKVRRGGNFSDVKNNIKRLQKFKSDANAVYPTFDSFFVLMESNFRELPAYLDLLRELNIFRATFETMLVDDRNLSRSPDLEDEIIQSSDSVSELHQILKSIVSDPTYKDFKLVWAGLKDLFDYHNLDSAFLNEEGSTLTPENPHIGQANGEKKIIFPEYVYPDLPALPDDLDLEKTANLCTNPWYTMFIIENGDVSLCFQAEPIGNLFETPLTEIWNGAEAIAKRSRMLSGQYIKSGCSALWCQWRDGKAHTESSTDSHRELLSMFESLTNRLRVVAIEPYHPSPDTKLGSVRRALKEKSDRITVLEANLKKLWDENATLHRNGQRYIDKLEAKIRAITD